MCLGIKTAVGLNYLISNVNTKFGVVPHGCCWLNKEQFDQDSVFSSLDKFRIWTAVMPDN